eukprot:PITA_24245
MNKEYESIMKNDVWDVVPKPKDKLVVTSKWLYKIKHGVDGSVEKFKARFVARGFSQNEGVDYDEIFAPVARYTTIRSIIALVASSDVDLNLYFKVEKDKPLILVLYVDDLFLTSDDPLIHQCKTELASEFEMKVLGRMHYFLGLEVWQKLGEIFFSQGKYIMKLLERCGIVDCKFVSTPMELNFKKLCGSVVGIGLANPSEHRQLVGALMFLVNSLPDICFVVNTLSQFMVEPHHIHWIAAKNLLRYLWGTIHYGLRYIVGNLRLHGYTDVDWAGSVVDRKSISGCCFSLGSASISWMSRK